MAKSGVQVPIRYDPADPQTLSIDSIAMGYGDPYESAKKSWHRFGEKVRDVTAPVFALAEGML